MCTATDGAAPVYLCTWAASSIFSVTVRGTPGWANTLNRVPVFPNAHDGVSIRWARNTDFTAVRSGISRHLQPARVHASLLHPPPCRVEVVGFQIADQQPVVAQEEAVVGPARLAQRGEHPGPDLPVGGPVLRQPVRPDPAEAA